MKSNGIKIPTIITSVCVGVVAIGVVLNMTGCQFLKSKITDIKGDLVGNTYECSFYSNYGEKFMTVNGEKINLESNIVNEPSYNAEIGWTYTEVQSSVVTITIDGKQIENCGSTVIFAEEGLEPDVDFRGIEEINSESSGLGDITSIASLVNEYKNFFGKGTVVVIQSQLGNPICAYSGNKVYWEVCEDLPKTTKLTIDGKALYIHRANFQIIDKALLN